jgi:cytochrome c-type biogenesis protein CcmH|tara:strand:+ start:59 stop:433 length:375 start_codon:yes stop_codon:yes gene_type:complete
MKTKIVIYIIFIFFAFSKYSFSNDLKLENKINKNLRCLICQGQSIYDSQSDFAESMKLVVKQKIESGMSEEEIYSFFKIQYGEWILYDPQFNTKNFALWLLPILVFLVGGIVILKKFRVSKKRL